MDEEYFIGLVYASHPVLNLRKTTYSIMTVVGGAVSQMDKDLTKKQMVLSCIYLGDFYLGTFKNGLKHGNGI